MLQILPNHYKGSSQHNNVNEEECQKNLQLVKKKEKFCYICIYIYRISLKFITFYFILFYSPKESLKKLKFLLSPHIMHSEHVIHFLNFIMTNINFKDNPFSMSLCWI